MGNRTPTDNKKLSTVPPKKGITFGLGTAARTDAVMSGTGYVKPINPEFDSFKEYLPGTEGIYAPEENWQRERAERQGKLAQTGSAITRIVGNVIPEIIQQTGNMLDFSGDFETDNIVGQWAQSWKDGVNEAAPIYREDPTAVADFGSYAYWMEQGSNLVTSAAAFAAVGWATGYVGGAAIKGAQGVGTAIRGSNAAREVGAVIDAGINASNLGTKIKQAEGVIKPIKDAFNKVASARNINGVGNAILMNKAEGIGVGLDTYQSVYAQELQKLQAANEDGSMSNAEIDTNAKKKAADAAAYAYNFNKVNILLNLSSSFAFVKPGVAGARQELAKVGLLNSLKTTGKEAAQEYTEEIVNYVAQKRAEAGDAGKDWKERIQSTMSDGMQEAFSVEGQEAGFWGALGGAAQTGFTRAGSYVRMHSNDMYKQEFKKEYANIQKKEYAKEYQTLYQKEYESAYNKLSEDTTLSDLEIDQKSTAIAERLARAQATRNSAETAQKEADISARTVAGDPDKRVSANAMAEYKNRVLTEERQKVKDGYDTLDEDGKVKLADAYGKIDLFNDTLDVLEIDGQYQEAYNRNDVEEMERLSNLKFDTRVLQSINNGTLNTLEDSLKTLSKLTPEEAVEAKVVESTDDLSYKTKAQKGLQQIKDIEKIVSKNSKYLNADNVTGLDLSIYRNAEKINTLAEEIKPFIEPLYETKRASLFDAHEKTAYAGLLSEEYYNKTPLHKKRERNQLGNADKRKAESTLEELQKGITLTDEELNSEEVAAKRKKLDTLDTIQKKAVQERQFLTSKEVQKVLKEARIEAIEQARKEKETVEARVREDKAKRAQEALKNKANKKTADEVAKQTTKDPVQPPVQNPVQTPSTTVVIPPVTPPVIDKPLTALEKLVDDYTKDMTPFMDDADLKEGIELLLGPIKGLRDIMKGDQIVPVEKIKTLIDNLENKSFLAVIRKTRNDEARELYKQYLKKTAVLAKQVLELQESAVNAVQGVQATADVEAGIGPYGEEYTDEPLDENEEGEQVVNLQEAIDKTSMLRKAAAAVDSLNKTVEQMESLGYPVAEYQDIENFLLKVLDKGTLIKLSPDLKRTWNSLMDLTRQQDKKVDESSFSTLDNLTQEEHLEKKISNAFWTDKKNQEVQNTVGELIDVNNENDKVLPTRRFSLNALNRKADFKSMSAFNLAYLAKPYRYIKNAINDAGEMVLGKVMVDLDRLNDKVDKRTFLPSFFKIGDELTLSPMRVGGLKHTYVEDGLHVEIERTSEDFVTFKYFTIDPTNGDRGAVKPELTKEHPVATHLPIYISKEGKRLKGMFMHLPKWVDENLGLSEEDKIKEKQALLAVRENVIANKGKNYTVKINAVSDGIYLSDGQLKPVSGVSENKPRLAILNDKQELRSGRDTLHEPNNNINLSKFNPGASFMVVDNGGEVYAMPVIKKPFEDLENGEDVANTIVKMIDVLMTKNKSEEQLATAKAIKEELGINPSNIKEVSNYIRKFLYLDFYRGDNPDGFMNYMNELKVSKVAIGTSVFNFGTRGKGKPYLQFGKIGDTGAMLIDSNTIEGDKEKILAALKGTILKSYLHTNQKYINSTKKMIVLNDKNKGSFIGESYEDYLRKNTFTTLKPETVNIDGKETEIYTIQRTIQIGEPVVPINTRSAAKKAVVEEVVTKEDEEGNEIEPVEEDNPFAIDEEGYEDDGGYEGEEDEDMYAPDGVYEEENSYLKDTITYLENRIEDANLLLEDPNITEEKRKELLDEISNNEYALGLAKEESEAILLDQQEETEEEEEDANAVLIESLADIYSFVPNVDAKTVQAIINDSYNYLVNNVLKNNKVGLNEALEQTIAKIEKNVNAYASTVRAKEAIPARNEKEAEQKEQATALNKRKLANRVNTLDTILANKEALKTKLKERISQDKLFLKGSAEEIAMYKRGLKLEQDKKAKEAEEKAKLEGRELTYDEEKLGVAIEDSDVASLQEDYVGEEFKIDEDDTVDNDWSKENIYVKSYDALDKRVKDFFRGINNRILNKKRESVPAVTLLGLPEYVEALDVYLTVQHILANYPKQAYKPANFKDYVALLKAEIPKKLYLQEVVNKLEDENLPSEFKIAFVNDMNKQYNNLIITDIKKDGSTKVIDINQSNHLKVSLQQWMGKFDNSGRYSMATDDTANVVKYINPNVMDHLARTYNKVMVYAAMPAGLRKEKDTAEAIFNIKNVYETLGIDLHPNFYKALRDGNLGEAGSIPYGEVAQFAKSPMFKIAIASVVGDLGLGIPPNKNLYTTPLFQNHGFNKLAKLNAEYEANLYGNSARDIGGNMVSNYSNPKNLTMAVLKNRDIEDYIPSTFTDPYRNITDQYDDTKPHKTWAESLVTNIRGKFTLNRGSLFREVFEPFMYNGASFAGDKGTNRVAVEKMTELGLVKTHFNNFLNQGFTQEKDDKKVNIGFLSFFTMSNKKIPSTFKVPLVRYSVSAVDNDRYRLLQEKAQEGAVADVEALNEASSQRELIFNSLVRPELNRIAMLGKEGGLDNIKIEGYEKKNLKFYGLPFLNDIDFDYIDGDRSKGLDTPGPGSLRHRLGLKDDINFTTIDRDPSNYGGMLINPLALEIDTVQQFMLDKVLSHLNVKYKEKKQEFADKQLITLDPDGKNSYFVRDKGIDLKAVAKFEGKTYFNDSPVMASDIIANFVINSQVGYANMQQLLVTDPIQFAKNKASSNILKRINKVESNITALKDMNSSDEDVLNRIENSLKELEILKENYRQAWIYQDTYDSYGNQAKRLAGDNASGDNIHAVDGRNSFNMLVIEDVEMESDVIDQYEGIFKKAGYNEQEVEKLLSGYKNINIGDGQEFSTLREHLDVMVGRALISAKDANAIHKADQKGKLSIKQYGQVLNSMKLVYNNNFMDADSGIHRRVYIKSSSFPLSKTFTKGLPIDALRELMDNNNIQRAAFASAVKVGAPLNKAKVFSKDGSVDVNFTKTIPAYFDDKGVLVEEQTIEGDFSEYLVKDIPREGHKNQTNLPYDENKQQKKDSTQQSKMQFNNMADVTGFIDPVTGQKLKGSELQERYNAVVDNYYKQKFFKLKNRIFKDNNINYEELHNILMEAAEERGYSQNAKSFFRLNEKKDGFFFPLWLSENSDKLEALLNSVVDNNVRIRKRRGFSKVLVSDSILDIANAQNSNIILLDKNRTDKLLPMRYDPDTKTMLPAEIVVTFPFRDNKGNLLNLNDFVVDGQLDTSKLPEDILEGMGLRIPYQGINSSSNVKIVGFLPADIDGVAFGPKDWINQMGSDFDADKINIDIYNTIYDEDTGGLRRVVDSDLDKYKEQKAYVKLSNKIKNLEAINEEKFAEKPDAAIMYDRGKVKIKHYQNRLDAMRKGVSQEEYLKDYHSAGDMNSKLLENKMTGYTTAILANPNNKVQAQRIQPIDSMVLLEIKDEIIPAVYNGKIDKNWTPYSHSFQIEKYMAAKGGKTGVSSFSSDAVTNAILQSVKDPVNFIGFDGEKYYDVYYNIYGKKSNALNKNTSIDGGYKSDIIQALQSIAVDNETLLIMDKLNLNDVTSDFVRAAIQLGYNAKDIFYIINHPVIMEVVKNKNNETKFLAPKNYIEEDGEKVYRTNKQYRALYKSFNHDDLRADIAVGAYDRNNPKHDAIYRLFEDLSSRGKQLKQLGSLLNVDSAGLGTNLLFSLNKEKAVDELYANNSISGISQILTSERVEYDDLSGITKILQEKETNPDVYKQARDEYERGLVEKGYVYVKNRGWVRNNSVPGSAIHYALRFNNVIWKKIFPYNTPKLSKVRHAALELSKSKNTDLFLEDDQNQFFKLNYKEENKVSKNYNDKNSITSTSPAADSKIESEALKTYRAYLYSSIGDLYGTTASDLRKKLVHSGYLAAIITDIKKEGLLPDNKIIGRLVVATVADTQGMQVPSVNILFDASTGDETENDRLLQDMISLLESKKTITTSKGPIKVSELGKMLVQHQMVTSGIQKANQFIKFIPYMHLNNIGLYENMKEKAFEDNERYIEQYIQHHPELVFSAALQDDVRTGDTFDEDNGIIRVSDRDMVFKEKDQRNKDYTDYVSIKDGNGKFKLFKKSPYDAHVYLSLSLLGEGAVTEYDASAQGTLVSGFEANVPAVELASNTEMFKESVIKGYLPKDVFAKIDSLRVDDDIDTLETLDKEKIYKKCD